MTGKRKIMPQKPTALMRKTCAWEFERIRKRKEPPIYIVELIYELYKAMQKKAPRMEDDDGIVYFDVPASDVPEGAEYLATYENGEVDFFDECSTPFPDIENGGWVGVVISEAPPYCAIKTNGAFFTTLRRVRRTYD